MEIRNLHIENFKAIKKVELLDLNKMVVIAGPNGCGKSTIFDAIRLIKSIYGGYYQRNEVDQWFSEFQININQSPKELLILFRDKEKPLNISIDIFLSYPEKQFITSNVSELLRPQIWQQYVPEYDGGIYRVGSPIAAQLRQYGKEVDERIETERKVIETLLNDETYHGEIVINPNKTRIEVSESPMLQFIFNMYDPQSIGVIDFHGSQRTYNREQVGGINLQIESNEQKSSQHALYNFANKYSNIKTEMATHLVRELLKKAAGINQVESLTLVKSLKDLFKTFFPGKTFNGPIPTEDGKLSFPVMTETGAVFDINDLSSGEKELLYGYLRLSNLSPKYSVLLIDEPELHLNPRLVEGLPQFYFRNLVEPLDNQIWLLTHSDAFLREALDTNGANVFHMKSLDEQSDENQIRPIFIEDELHSAVIELVGDLAIYIPGSSVVIFEGEPPNGFDVEIIGKLFPNFAKKNNLISCGNKILVNRLYEIIQKAKESGKLPFKVFAVVDGDFEIKQSKIIDHRISWDVYHIENYLLEPKYIYQVLDDAYSSKNKFKNERELKTSLFNCAEIQLDFMVENKLRVTINDVLKPILNFDTNSDIQSVSEKFSFYLEGTLAKLEKEIQSSLSKIEIKNKEDDIREILRKDLRSERWMKTFPGRRILKEFAKRNCPGIRYDQLRNLIISKMVSDSYQPAGIRNVIDLIEGSEK